MTEPKAALSQFTAKRQELLGELNQLRLEVQQRQELLLRVEGAIEAMTIIGVTPDEPAAGPAAPSEEAAGPAAPSAEDEAVSWYQPLADD